jgi:hypothetical protein
LKRDELLAKSTILSESNFFKHVLSHQKLIVRFITIQPVITKKKEKAIQRLGLKWLTRKQVEKIPKPILIERFLKEEIHDQDF